MKVPLKQKLPPKPRVLLFYDADHQIDVAHPLYSEITVFGEKFEEVHVIVTLKQLPNKFPFASTLGSNIFLYYICEGSIIFTFDEIRPFLRYHLVWRARFRPDLILNYSERSTIWIAYFFARHYQRPLTMVTSGTFLDLPFFSRMQLRQYIVAKSATQIIAPGEFIANNLISRIHVRTEKVSVITPAIDMKFLEGKIAPISFAKQFPPSVFFLVSHVTAAHQRDLAFLLNVYTEIHARYRWAGLVLMVPSAHVGAIEKIVATKQDTSINVVGADDTIGNYFAGANIFLSVSESADTTKALIQSLSLHTPVVTTATPTAKEIFTGSRYEQFVQPFGDVRAYSAAVIELIEHQQVRDEYRLNASVLLDKIKVQTVPGYMATLIATITKTVE